MSNDPKALLPEQILNELRAVPEAVIGHYEFWIITGRIAELAQRLKEGAYPDLAQDITIYWHLPLLLRQRVADAIEKHAANCKPGRHPALLREFREGNMQSVGRILAGVDDTLYSALLFNVTR